MKAGQRRPDVLPGSVRRYGEGEKWGTGRGGLTVDVVGVLLDDGLVTVGSERVVTLVLVEPRKIVLRSADTPPPSAVDAAIPPLV